MSKRISRRPVLIGGASLALSALGHGASGDAPDEGLLRFGASQPFSFDRLKRQAQSAAAAPFVPPSDAMGDVLEKIDYDAWGKIRFKTDDALFASGPYPVTFFHLGRFFQRPMAIYAVRSGTARRVLADERLFAMPLDSPARSLPQDAGFAGFRIQEARQGSLDWRANDWTAFLGASYFRAIGALGQYGLSARGLAVDTAVADRREEFPAFTNVYIESAPSVGAPVTVYALLEGPSVVGAFKFLITRGQGVVMDVEQTLYLRESMVRMGVAPLTSMYWFSETAKPTAIDWRPEVHDSDGLALWTGANERLWRPLNDPAHVAASAFVDENPKGFGLLQRDRVFDHYLDGVHYERRPSLWIEPRGSWGRGSVQLIELPTDDEVNDNIVAAWVPETPAAAGTQWTFAYRLHWLADEPYPSSLARCVATRLGRGGQPGRARPVGSRKFLVEFLGGPLATLAYGVKPDMEISTTKGQIGPYRLIEAVPDGVVGHWRAQFDVEGVTGDDPAELRLKLLLNGVPASETWLFQYRPLAPAS